MKMRIEFDMDSFGDDPGPALRAILIDIAYRVCENAETGRGICDLDGKRIGQWVIED